MKETDFFVYMLSNEYNTVLYVGVTSDLMGRAWQHRNSVVSGFTEKYNVHKLVYFERHTSIEGAIRREKRLKKYQRKWKEELVTHKCV